MPRHRWLVPALAIALAGLAPTPSFADLTLTVAEFDSPTFLNGWSFTVDGGTQTINLTPGQGQDVKLDLKTGNTSGSSSGTFTGTATSDITLGGITESISQTYEATTTVTSHSAGLSVALMAGSPIVFNFGTYEVTVTPIASADGYRHATFLETPLSAAAVPEPSTIWIAALGGAAFAG
jgi:hypothetical protein